MPETGMSGTRQKQTAKPPCDLVMRGGITSGVAYPLAIAELMKHFRLQAIGGASAGAIAAAVAAAAEFGRRATPSSTPVQALRQLTDEIGGTPGIRRLLRPDAPGPLGWLARALWPLLPILQAAGGLSRRWLGLSLGGVVLIIVAVALVAAIVLPGEPDAATMVRRMLGWLAALGAAVLAVVLLLWRGLRALADTGFGLCSGIAAGLNAPGVELSAERLRREGALMDWLHAAIQDLARRSVGKVTPDAATELADADQPLLMRDLWGGDRFGERQIDLLLTTTNLGQHLPHQFPFLERGWAPLYFDPAELARVLPRDVVAWMMQAKREPDKTDPPPPKGLCRLPDPDDLPVLFGVRLSLSFPGLIAAVPLHVLDEENAPRRVWFSDGGITSNFPVDVFDAPLPRRPTFCINLRSARRSEADGYHRTLKEKGAGDEAEDTLVVIARDNALGTASVVGPPRPGLGAFLGSIFDTARNARENELILTPGYRDRIVEIAMLEGEGGLKLGMDADTIRRIATRGQRAAQRLVQEYGAPDGISWTNQRWIRLRATLAAQERLLADIRAAWWHLDPAWGRYPDVMAGWAPRDAEGPQGAACRRREPAYGWKDDAAADRAARMTLRLIELAETLEQEAAAAAPTRPRQGRSVFDGDGDGQSWPEGSVAHPRIGLRQRSVGGDPRANMTWR
jgi:predicted acylesterase/phospholipase RssA